MLQGNVLFNDNSRWAHKVMNEEDNDEQQEDGG
jgi:hypothetical protein